MVAHELDVLERAVGRHEREREVEPPALDEGEQLVLVGRLLEAHLEPGPQLHETAHDVRQDADRDALERADAQRARRALGERREVGLGRLQLGGQADGVAQHALARVVGTTGLRPPGRSSRRVPAARSSAAICRLTADCV